jgi:hypothetical protein
VAFGKLHGMLASAPLNLPGKNVANLSMAAGSLAAGAALLTTGDPATGLVGRGVPLALVAWETATSGALPGCCSAPSHEVPCYTLSVSSSAM